MELTHEHFRTIILYNFRRGLSQQECIDKLKFFFGDEAPCYSTMKKQFNLFHRSRRSLKDEIREGPSLAFWSFSERTLMPCVNC